MCRRPPLRSFPSPIWLRAPTRVKRAACTRTAATCARRRTMPMASLSPNPSCRSTGTAFMIGLGESTALDEFTEFLTLARTDPAINPAVVFVTGAQGGATPSLLTLTDSPYWNTILNNFLPEQGLTANQVVAMWIEDSNGIAKGS